MISQVVGLEFMSANVISTLLSTTTGFQNVAQASLWDLGYPN